MHDRSQRPRRYRPGALWAPPCGLHDERGPHLPMLTEPWIASVTGGAPAHRAARHTGADDDHPQRVRPGFQDDALCLHAQRQPARLHCPVRPRAHTRARAHSDISRSLRHPPPRSRPARRCRARCHRVERNILEHAFAHYREQGKRVKSARDKIARSAAADLIVRYVPATAPASFDASGLTRACRIATAALSPTLRYNFKIATYAELRQDPKTALKYCACSASLRASENAHARPVRA